MSLKIILIKFHVICCTVGLGGRASGITEGQAAIRDTERHKGQDDVISDSTPAKM